MVHRVALIARMEGRDPARRSQPRDCGATADRVCLIAQTSQRLRPAVAEAMADRLRVALQN